VFHFDQAIDLNSPERRPKLHRETALPFPIDKFDLQDFARTFLPAHPTEPPHVQAH